MSELVSVRVIMNHLDSQTAKYNHQQSGISDFAGGPGNPNADIHKALKFRVKLYCI